MKKNILALEQEVKKQYALDRSDGHMYETIKDLASAILVVKKLAFNSTEVDEISHMCAEDLFIKINYEGLNIEGWTKYVYYRLLQARSQYLWECRKVEIEINDPIDSNILADTICNQSNTLQKSINLSEMYDTIESISYEISDIFDKYVRYSKSSIRYSNIKSSILLTFDHYIRTGKLEVISMNTDSDDNSYIILLIKLIKKEISYKLRTVCEEHDSNIYSMNNLVSAGFNTSEYGDLDDYN